MIEQNDTALFTGSRRYLSIGETMHQLFSRSVPPILMQSVTVVSSDMKLNESTIRNALRILSLKHTMLHSKIVEDENSDFYLEEMVFPETDDTWIPVSFDTISDTKHWTEILQREMKAGFTELLWRLIWLENISQIGPHEYVLIFICSHDIMDGKAAFDLMANQLPKILNCLVGKGDVDALPKPLRLVKSCEELFAGLSAPVSQEHVKWYIRAGISLFTFFSGLFKSNKPNIRVHDAESMSESDCCFYPFVVDEHVTKDVLHFSKEGKVSVHSIFTVALSYALEKTRESYPAFQKAIRKIYFPVDLRKFHSDLGTSPMPCGVFFSPGKVEISPIKNYDQSHLLSIVKTVNENVQRQNRAILSPLLLTASLPFLQDKRNNVVEMLQGLGLGSVVSLSNIGNCSSSVADVDSLVKIKEHYFSLSLVPDTLFLSTCTLNGKMFFNVVFNGRWLSKDFIKDLHENFTHTLQHFVTRD